ncbi:MAG TPA: hypothetical protein VF175_01810 [Lacipirellula sp.]
MRLFAPLLVLGLLAARTQSVQAVVIDDFATGPISLENSLIGGFVDEIQTGLDPAHVAGGMRTWRYDVRSDFASDPPSTAKVRMGVGWPASLPPGEGANRFYYQADDELTAVNFWLTYDAGVGSGAGPGLDIDLQALGHNALVLDVLNADFDDNNGHLDILAHSDSDGRSSFTPLPNSAKPYRAVAPLFRSTQPALGTIKRLRIGTSNGVLFGDFELGEIRTMNTADANFTGSVDGADFLVWQRNLGSGASDIAADSVAKGDADLDGLVAAADLDWWSAAVRRNAVAPAASMAIPEPASLALACLALISLRKRS